MCQKCVVKAKNLGKPKTITQGQVRFYARQLLSGHSIPVFDETAANYAIEAHIYKIQQARSKGRYDRRQK